MSIAQRYTSLPIGDSSVVVATGPHDVYGFVVDNRAAATRYVQIFDQAVIPTGPLGPQPILQIVVGSGDQVSFDATKLGNAQGGNGLHVQTGFAFGSSSTGGYFVQATGLNAYYTYPTGSPTGIATGTVVPTGVRELFVTAIYQ
jgi:hypothetical protein